ncbi:MAG: M20/M25/M40 family metallo-hydrolase [Nitrospinales bacterium]
MLRLLSLAVILFSLWAPPAWPRQAEPVRHDLAVTLDPDGKRLAVEDRVTLPESSAGSGPPSFLLHAGLQPKSATPGVTVVPVDEPPGGAHFGPDFDAADLPGNLELFRVTGGRRDFVITYEGTLHHPPENKGTERARAFGETPGTVSPDGVFLAGGSYWYPWFGDGPLTFSMDVRLPPGWDAVSQGNGPLHERDANGARTRWESPEPQYEIFLLAGKYTEYHRQAGRVQAQVFLRKPDENLANRYLDVTGQYLQMYGNLFGPYAYKKFALVENFWETGYGMPSFTLLGPRVIRFPFILHSSYPHEILHNWWGNGVYVDPRSGNWSEGLTAYLADHLIKQQRGRSAAYRRTTLRKYTDYVRGAKDFPLARFRSRHSSATEAVGYGKSLMVFHMLRRRLGDEAFVNGLQRFYRQHKFRRAGYEDIRKAFANAEELQSFFDQWIAVPGAPKLEIGRAEVVADAGGFILKADLQQVQEGAAYRLRVPLAVTLGGNATAHQTTAVMNGKHLALQLRLPARPLRLDVDPEFDVFRRLDRNEIPPALTQVFGAEKVLVILPSREPAMLEPFRGLARALASGQAEIRLDNEVETLPAGRAVWVFGWSNRFREQVFEALRDYPVTTGEDGVSLASAPVPRNGNSLVLTARHPADPQRAIAWVGADNPAALPGLGRKLPHYHKYSYLAFKGDEPANFQKGQWPVTDSPMTVFLPDNTGATVRVERARLAPRKALADLPPVFSKASMMKTIRHLSAPEFKGRGFGSPELARAADFIAEQFRGAGLLPGGKDGTYFQTWTARGGDPETSATMKNVVAILPGTRAEWQGQSVVVTAHYDHLGLGWPDARAGNKGKIHPGADDNASGVAVLLELARTLGKSLKPHRTVVFAAFTGEEAELQGSKFYVAHAGRFPAGQIMGMVNMDTVGRLGRNKLTIFGAGSATEWPHIFRGVGFVTGVPVQPVADDLGASDQKSFLDAGVPAVQIFSGANRDYHSPTDTADKIDPDGLLKVAAVVKETVEYLAGRDRPLTSTLGGKDSAAAPATTETRKVSLGTIPDFAYEGRGVRLENIVPGSPAEQAGLAGGDIIKQVNAADITNLRDLSELLKTLNPGDKVSITFTRGEKEHKTETRVRAR